MARTARSLADRTVAAAKRVTGRGSSEQVATAVPAVKKTAKRTTATSAVKKAAPTGSATGSAAKKAAGTKKTAAKTTAKQAPAKKATGKAPAAKATSGPAKAAPVKAGKASTGTAPATRTATTKAAPAPAKGTATKTAVKKTSAKTSGSDRAVSATAGTSAKPRKSSSSAARSLAVKADEKPWTTAELDEVRGELNADRDRLRSELNLAEHDLHDLMRDAGDGAGNDQADVGSTTFERDHEMSLANNARDMLAQTERALARIQDGSYGVCESCGQPIGKMRVMAFPRATLCLSCKQREERR